MRASLIQNVLISRGTPWGKTPILTTSAKLHAVMYHYVRDLPRTQYPKIKGMMLDEFRQQVAWFASQFEMATLESALAFLRGEYRPAKDLCIFTFDDGLKEHYTDVTPILSDYKIQGLFGVITSCIEDRIVAPVHMNHFLTATMGFESYQQAFMKQLADTEPAAWAAAYMDSNVAAKSYPLDAPHVATFKFFFNFTLDSDLRDKIVTALFEKYVGDQKRFSQELYMSWEEVRQIQRAGMLVAGHTHWHRPLSTLTSDELYTDLCISRSLLNENLEPQQLWPFSYPYGKRNSYSDASVQLLQQLGYTCAFNTECGANAPGASMYELQRIDCNGAIQQLQS